MRFILLIAFIAFANAQEYREALKAGQRHFTSGLKQGAEGIKYDIKLVEGYHSLDQEGEVESILCGAESVLILANEKLDWKAGDVFTGDNRWQCGEGIARKVKEVALKGEKDGKFEYVVKTEDAALEDIFEYADIQFVNPESEAEFDARQKLEQEGLKAEPKEFSKTFTMADKTITLFSNSYLTSTINAKAELPIWFGNFDCKVNLNKEATYFKTKAKVGIIVTLTWNNELKVDYEKSVQKDLYSFSKYTISITAGPVVVSISLKPRAFVGCDVDFHGKATAKLTYKKHFSSTITLDTSASKKLTASAADETSGATPTFSASVGFSGSAAPYAGAEVTIGIGLYGIDIVSGSPYLKFKIQGTLTTSKITITPKLLFGYSIKIIAWTVSANEYTLYTAGTKTITYRK